jgi:hypothetical protein
MTLVAGTKDQRAPTTRTMRTSDAWLMRATVLFALAVVLHNADHLRRGADAVSRDVFWLGTSGIAFEVAIVVLICQRHRLAPLAAAAGGFFLAAGYLEVHFLPAHSWLSDSFTSASGVSPLSWLAASLEVLAALALCAAGLGALSHRGGLASATQLNPEDRTLRESVLHPVALAFALSQVVVLVVSFAQL